MLCDTRNHFLGSTQKKPQNWVQKICSIRIFLHLLLQIFGTIFKNHQIFPFFSDELGYLVDAIVNEDKIDSFDSRPNNMSIEDKHLLSRLLLLLNPNYSNLAGGGGGGGGRNRRPSRRKKPIINVIEGN